MRNRRRSVSAIFEAVERRQHMAADLVVSSIATDRSLLPLTNANSSNLTIGITNQGTSAVDANTPFVVTVYYVDNLFETPTALKSATVSGLGIFQTKVLAFSNVSGYRPADNEGYIFAAVDTSNVVAESNESNNSYRGVGLDMLRYSMEADVSSPHSTVVPRALALDGKFIDGVIGDEIIGGADIDTYKVTLQAGKHYWFEMYEVNNAFNGAMRLINQQYATLATSTGDTVHGGFGAYIEFTPAATQDYYLAISTEANVNGPIHILDGRVETGDHGAFKLAAAEIDPPTVVIASLDPAAVEGSPSDPTTGLEFTITRQWVSQPWRPLTVKLSYSGQFSGDLVTSLPTEITIPANQYSVKFTSMPVNDGVNEPTETEYVQLVDDPSYVLLGAYRAQTLTIFDDPATHHPFATGSGFVGLDRPGPRTFIGFSEDVGYSITRDDYLLTNLDTGAVIPSNKLEVLWSPTINSSIVYFSGYTNGQLPDGNYRLTLRKNGVYTWPDGHQLMSDVTIDFASLAGDTNNDRRVDFTDLLTVAQNYNADLAYDGGAGKGDFDRNGKVDFSDLLILAQNYGKQLSVPLTNASMATSSPKSSTRKHEPRFASDIIA